MKSEIKAGPFTLLVSLCGQYHVAPGGIHISSIERAEAVAALYARRMTNA